MASLCAATEITKITRGGGKQGGGERQAGGGGG